MVNPGILIGVAVGVFWVSVAVILGVLWHKFKPDSQVSMVKKW